MSNCQNENYRKQEENSEKHAAFRTRRRRPVGPAAFSQVKFYCVSALFRCQRVTMAANEIMGSKDVGLLLRNQLTDG